MDLDSFVVRQNHPLKESSTLYAPNGLRLDPVTRALNMVWEDWSNEKTYCIMCGKPETHMHGKSCVCRKTKSLSGK